MASNLKFPDNYQTVMPYLIVEDGTKFISFMQKVFNAEETHRSMRDEHTIMHAEIMIGGSTIMLADSTEKFAVRTGAFFIYVANADETFKKAIDAGATVVTQLAEQSYGRSGGVQDPFGNIWWVTSITKG